MPAAEIAVLGLAIGKLLLRCADLNDSADALEDAGAAARALKVLRSGKRRDQVTQVVSELIDDRLGGVSDPTRREQMRIAAGNVATVFDGLTDDALRQAAQDPEAFPAWVLSGPGRSLVASTEEALTPLTEELISVGASVFAQLAPRSSSFTSAALVHLLRRVDDLNGGVGEVHDLLQEIAAAVKSVRGPAHPVVRLFGSRPRRAAGFVDRPEMDQLVAALERGQVATVCPLVGMRGVGKSQLAAAYAQSCEELGWEFVGWVDATSREAVVTQLAELAAQLGVAAEGDSPAEAARRAVMQVSNLDGRRVLVFDNVESVGHLSEFMPRGPGMQVVVTTTQESTVLGTPVKVGVYEEDQAREYLIEMTDINDPVGAALVAGDLGALPAALAQAAGTIRLLGYNFAEYRERLAAEPLDALMYREDGSSYPALVGAALRLGYTTVLDALADDGTDLVAAAERLLGALAHLAEAGVPRAWGYAVADETAARNAVGRLLASSVLSESADRITISMHRLMAQVIREDRRTADPSSPVAVLRAGLAHAARANDYWVQRHILTALAAQLTAILTQRQSQFLCDEAAVLRVAHDTGFHALTLGDPYLAIRLDPYVAASERVLGGDHPDTLTSRNNLAAARNEFDSQL